VYPSRYAEGTCKVSVYRRPPPRLRWRERMSCRGPVPDRRGAALGGPQVA
jgi:hypothetical protein